MVDEIISKNNLIKTGKKLPVYIKEIYMENTFLFSKTHLIMLLIFIIYYTIENPDIELLEDVTRLKSEIDESSNTKMDFLFNLSYFLKDAWKYFIAFVPIKIRAAPRKITAIK